MTRSVGLFHGVFAAAVIGAPSMPSQDGHAENNRNAPYEIETHEGNERLMGNCWCLYGSWGRGTLAGCLGSQRTC